MLRQTSTIATRRARSITQQLFTASPARLFAAAAASSSQSSALPALKDSGLFRQQNFIDGKWVPARSGKTVAVRNPATAKELGTVPHSGAAETREAIEAAQRAFVTWRARPARERAAAVRKFYDLMIQHKADLGAILTAEVCLLLPHAEELGRVHSKASR